MHTVGSVCSGYDGLALGVLDVLGGRLAWVADPDPDAARVLAHRYPEVPNHGDITCADHSAGCRWDAVDRPDVLVGGFPCQPWSNAGARLGAGDARDLWPAVAHAVGVLRPRLVVLENVARFARLRAGAGRTVGDLAGLGYDARWTVLRAADIGAPHGRARWFCLAWDRAAAADAARNRLARPRDGGRRATG